MSERQVMLTMGLVCVVLLAFGVYATVEEREEWLKFSRDHNCVEVGYIKGDSSVITTIGTNGQVGMGVINEDDKTTYKCNNGRTYTR